MPDVLLLLLGLTAFAAPDAASHVWIRSPANLAGHGLARVLPEVHDVQVNDEFVEIRSAGISLYNLGILQYPVRPKDKLQDIRVRIPRIPSPQPGIKISVPSGATGLFINGVPIPNQLESESFEGRNLWHFDLLARNSRDAHTALTPLLSKLLNDGARPSPIIGFALDGYPIYGPWAYANRDGTGDLRRMRSSYRLRSIQERCSLPEGTMLTSGQYGPRVGPEYPLGTFSEDYEFTDGWGDLDRFNGRFSKTPEYSQGAYAYFLSTGELGRMVFPYLLATHYYGKLLTDPSDCGTGLFIGRRPHLVLRACPEALIAGKPVSFRFDVHDDDGRPIRSLEHVHERPIHLIVVSNDLVEFDHIHPERLAGDSFQVEHTFRYGGHYRLYADFTPPGLPQQLEAIDVNIAGNQRPLQFGRLTGDKVKRISRTLRAGVDQVFRIRLRDTSSQEPYLGAWGHFVVIDEHLTTFIHAHPIDALRAGPAMHSHSAVDVGSPPEEIRFQAVFPRAGRYKLWAQFQIAGKVHVFPFVLRVNQAVRGKNAARPIPDAVRLTVGPNS